MVNTSFLEQQAATNPEDTNTITNVEMAEKLNVAINKLPTQNQEIFKLSRYRGFTNEEIALELGITKRTVETHISNALKKLRAELLTILLLLLNIYACICVFHFSTLSYI